MPNGKPTELRRDLGTWAAASIVVGTVIGSGIFLVPKTMIQRVGTVEWCLWSGWSAACCRWPAR